MNRYELCDSDGNYTVTLIQSVTDVDAFKNIDPTIESHLKQWLMRYHYNPAFSCAGFLYYMIHGDISELPTLWNVSYTDIPNDYIYLWSAVNCQNFHYALHLPESKLYLSQFGNGGDVVICDLMAMERFFETDHLSYVDQLNFMIVVSEICTDFAHV